MSIIIRQQCQPLLDAANLSDLHVDILNKTLTIVGPCGQPILTISGIRFDANAPKKAEISYAVELFSQFLEVHKEKILHFIQAKRAFSELPQPEYTGTLGRPATYGRKAVNYPNCIKVEASGEVSISTTLSSDLTLDQLIEQVNAAIEDSTLYVAQYKAYTEAERELTTLQSQLTKCDI